MAGLIGSSNSPVSGVGILAILGAALSVGMVARQHHRPGRSRRRWSPSPCSSPPWCSRCAVIANDNLQDLKTGQLVGATPWKQQVALIVGVVAGSVVVPPVLELLNRAYGFAGAPNLQAISDSRWRRRRRR